MKLKRVMIAMLISILVLNVVLWDKVMAETYLGTLEYWCSDEDTIGHWTSTPKIYYEKLSNTSTFYLSSALATARTQWNSALNIDMTIGGEGSGISFYGGFLHQMALMGYWTLTTTANGATRIWNSSEEGYYTWNGKKKSCKNINLTISCIIDKELSSDGYKETATHELGHALGWF